jgi:hypothetical protein
VDAAPQNDPTYPIIRRTNEEQKGYHWGCPTQQLITMEMLHSNKRPNVTAVFGTPLAPKELSGKIRRYDFQYGESSYGHWLLPLLADRVDEIERINCYNIFCLIHTGRG